MTYSLSTIEITDDPSIPPLTVYRDRRASLAVLVRIAHGRGWVPGAVSHTGLTIVGIVFESVS